MLSAKLVVWRRKNQQNGEEAGGCALSDDERGIFIGYHCPQAARNSWFSLKQRAELNT
jgi:hypothetical protein